jgi:hypothetical protein
MKTKIISTVLLFLVSSISSLAMSDGGVRNRKNNVLPSNSSNTSIIGQKLPTSLIFSMPEEVIVLIIGQSNHKGKCALSVSCKRLHELVKKNSLIALTNKHPIYEKLTTLSTQQLLKDEDFMDLSLDWSELKAIYKKYPASPWYTELRDCEKYNNQEEKQIKYAFAFCKLSRLQQDALSPEYGQAKTVLTKAAAPGCPPFGGAYGVAIGLAAGAYFGGNVCQYCGGGLIGLGAGIAAFMIGSPSVILPLWTLESHMGNSRFLFSSDDVKLLLANLDDLSRADLADDDQ